MTLSVPKRYPKSLWSHNPLPRDCVLYLPLWSSGLSGPRYKSADPYRYACINYGPTWNGDLGRYFDGDDDRIFIATKTGISDIFDGGGTMLAWVNPASSGEGGFGRIVDKYAANAGWNFRVLDEAAGMVKLAVYYSWSGDNTYWRTDATVIDINAWSLVGFTYNADATTNRPLIYADGVSKAFGEDVPTGTRDTDAATDLYVGNSSSVGDTFDGYIGEVWFHTRILSAAEILYIFGRTKGRYL